MQGFWEAVGHMLTDEEFATDVFNNKDNLPILQGALMKRLDRPVSAVETVICSHVANAQGDGPTASGARLDALRSILSAEDFSDSVLTQTPAGLRCLGVLAVDQVFKANIARKGQADGAAYLADRGMLGATIAPMQTFLKLPVSIDPKYVGGQKNPSVSQVLDSIQAMSWPKGVKCIGVLESMDAIVTLTENIYDPKPAPIIPTPAPAAEVVSPVNA